MKEKLKATPIFDQEDYFAWIITVTINGETMPISKGEDVLEFNNSLVAEEWIFKHSDKFY